jgi:ABC-type transport system involved in multi-copper enzyme maturation permease subunit
MNLPALLFAIRWLIRDTHRQARAAGLLGAVLLVTAVCTLLCLSMGVQGDPSLTPLRPWEDRHYLPRAEVPKHDAKDLQGIDVPRGEYTILFGAFRVPLSRTREEAVRFVQALLAGGVADTAGVLLALIWTAGFLPSFFDPHAASVLVAKPVPRWVLLVGKFLGVLAFVALQATLFIAATWLALGVRTNVWSPEYFLSIPILLVHFACFYSVSAFLAVMTRSTIACALGTIGFWLICWGVNYARVVAVTAGTEGLTTAAPALEAAYWLLPKPADLGLLLLDVLDANAFFAKLPALQQLQQRGGVHPDLSVFSSLVLPVVVLAVATWQLARTEY